VGVCSCQVCCFSLYGEMWLCSTVDVASFPASSEQSTNSVYCHYKRVTADRYRFWYRWQYRRYRYQTDTTGIGPIPIPSTGIGLSLIFCLQLAALPAPAVRRPVRRAVGRLATAFLPARRFASAGNSNRNVFVRLSIRHAPVLCENEES